MGTESKERAAVAQAYSSESWAYKVKHMSDAQVIAVYKRLKQQGKI
ncbi:MAG: hypothetical protein JWO15_3523 [Sphingomonadales bacterium]|nr:hypothetical protein [Sphingomonadales bacterium]